MRRRLLAALTLATSVVALIAPTAAVAGPIGLTDLDLSFTDSDGTPAMQAGSHPFQLTTANAMVTEIDPGTGQPIPVTDIKDLDLSMPPGFVGDPTAVPRCTAAEFLSHVDLSGAPQCPDASAVGTARIEFGELGKIETFPVYSLVPPPGVVAKLGFSVVGRAPVSIDLVLSPDPPYNVIARVDGISQVVFYYDSLVRIWGVPANSAHDKVRGSCLTIGKGTCPVNIVERPFITMPTSCTGPLQALFRADSWQEPGSFFEETVFTHDNLLPPQPLGVTGCSKLGFTPTISAKPTTKAASSPTGLDFSLDVADQGLTSPTGYAASTIEKAVVTLPEGFSANPSLAEGLNVCAEAQLAQETAFSEPGAGCPNGSKIGTVEVESPLLEENVNGSLFIAKPYENPFSSLLAMYIVIKNPTLGIIVKQALKIVPDPVTGQLTTIAEELPQLPFSHFKLHFREGARSPLASPPACGTYDARAELTPWSGGPPVTTASAFQIITGPGEGPCPTGGLPPFKPGLLAGTLNNRAGSFSPFNLRLSRTDSEQEITHFSIKLPPGITGKLAGIPYCSDAQIEAAKARTGPHGGQEELDNPSCPAASEIGRTLAGAGVGPSLTYAPGKVYLAGPYHGSNLSMVAITAGKVGPFDIGTVVIREAFKIDPETAEVFIDSQGSDPIPHIIRGIPVHLRDIRAYVDKPEFVLNPTDCTKTSTASTVLGSGLDFVSDADDNPITVTSPFQAADCAALPFKPQLSMKLIGGTRRGAHPKFTAHLAMNGIGESGIASAQVTLPKSEFIENAHFNTICTRVQFKEGAGNGAACPSGSIYGHARAATPILGEPLEGPVFLRSSEHQLPDLVVALHNAQLDFDLVGHVDSVKGGGLRNTFETAPDAPVTSFDIELEGASKGLFVNSTNLCAKKHFATAGFTGQNGKAYNAKPELKVKCKGKGRKHKRHAKRRHKRHAGR
jgi:hypothetical protein